MTYKAVDLSSLAANLRAKHKPTPLYVILTIFYKAKRVAITDTYDTVRDSDLEALTKWLTPEIEHHKPATRYMNGPFFSYEIRVVVEIIFKKELGTIYTPGYRAKFHNYTEHVIHTILTHELYS